MHVLLLLFLYHIFSLKTKIGSPGLLQVLLYANNELYQLHFSVKHNTGLLLVFICVLHVSACT